MLDDYGREIQGATAFRVFEHEHISALYAVLTLVVANGGHEIVVGEHGVLPDGLPALPSGSLAQLRRNGYLVTAQEGSGVRVGLGQRSRDIAAKWGIDLPAS